MTITDSSEYVNDLEKKFVPLIVTRLNRFTSFATALLHEPTFEWTVSTSKVRLTALGTIFENVTLSKVVSFKAFNGLPGVTISNFKLPSDDPAGGIHIETDALIPSAARGFIISCINFPFSPDVFLKSWVSILGPSRSSPSSRTHLLVVSCLDLPPVFISLILRSVVRK